MFDINKWVIPGHPSPSNNVITSLQSHMRVIKSPVSFSHLCYLTDIHHYAPGWKKKLLPVCKEELWAVIPYEWMAWPAWSGQASKPWIEAKFLTNSCWQMFLFFFFRLLRTYSNTAEHVKLLRCFFLCTSWFSGSFLHQVAKNDGFY